MLPLQSFFLMCHTTTLRALSFKHLSIHKAAVFAATKATLCMQIAAVMSLLDILVRAVRPELKTLQWWRIAVQYLFSIGPLRTQNLKPGSAGIAHRATG